MSRRTSVVVVAGCLLIALLEAPSAVRLLMQGWRGPYFQSTATEAIASTAASEVPVAEAPPAELEVAGGEEPAPTPRLQVAEADSPRRAATRATAPGRALEDEPEEGFPKGLIGR